MFIGLGINIAASSGDRAAPTITSSASPSVAENATLAHSLTANESVTWSIVGGADQARFELSGSTLRWASNGTKDFEAPDDADTNNTYVVTVRATDLAGNTSDQTITVTVTDVADDPFLASNVLLLGFEGQADGSTTITDESTTTNKGNATANGNVQIDTGAFKFGAGSLLFDGTGDYASWADHADWRLSAANADLFTIEFWVTWNANVSNQRIMGHSGTSGNIGWYVNSTTAAGTNNDLISFVYSSDGNAAGSLVTTSFGSNNFVLGTWYFIAISKNSAGKIRLWVDGALVASQTPADSSFFNSTNAFELGRALASAVFNGALDEVRITKGVCRYDTDGSITVPTAAFPRI